MEFEDVPVFEDHIGPSPPHELNIPPSLAQFKENHLGDSKKEKGKSILGGKLESSFLKLGSNTQSFKIGALDLSKGFKPDKKS